MKATIDAAGRIVVPKPLRQALGLKPGQLLEMRAGDGRLEIEIVPTSVTLKKRGKGMVAVPNTKLPPLTAEQGTGGRWSAFVVEGGRHQPAWLLLLPLARKPRGSTTLRSTAGCA
jgi:AbrB family looped-hinge helix DNA binding protein